MVLIFGKSLAGAGYVVLNALRVLNIMALLAVITASVVMLVKTFIVSKFYFFDACEHIVRVIICIFLIVTELPLFKPYVARNWPLFSEQHGFVMLGFAMIFLGNSILGNLNKEATSQESLGMDFWRIVIGAGIVIFVMGFVNILASYVFRDTRIALTARQVRSHGATASQHAMNEASTPKPPSDKSHYRSFFLGARREALPSYHPHSNEKGNGSQVSQTPKMHMAISSPVTASPSSKYSSESPKPERYVYAPQLRRPESVQHPAVRTGQAL